MPFLQGIFRKNHPISKGCAHIRYKGCFGLFFPMLPYFFNKNNHVVAVIGSQWYDLYAVSRKQVTFPEDIY